MLFFTGRNEVLAKVMFSQASVIHSVHRGGCLLHIFGGVPAPNFRGGGGCLLQIFGGGACSKFWGGACFKFSGGVPAPNFWGGVCLLQIFWGGACSKFSGGCLLQIFGGVPAPNFQGGCLLQIFGGGACSKFFWGVSNFRNTVNVWPVRILLECILVYLIVLITSIKFPSN